MQLQRAHHEIEATGANVVLIGQATAPHAAHFRSRMQLDLPVLADERRCSYEAAGAKIATMSELLGPKVIAKGAAASRRHGVVQGRTIGHPAQLGGAMVVMPDASIPWSHLSEDASDNPSAEEIVAALRSASA